MGHLQGWAETQGVMVLEDPMMDQASDPVCDESGHFAERAAHHRVIYAVGPYGFTTVLKRD